MSGTGRSGRKPSSLTASENPSLSVSVQRFNPTGFVDDEDHPQATKIRLSSTPVGNHMVSVIVADGSPQPKVRFPADSEPARGSVLALSAYATILGRSLVLADPARASAGRMLALSR